MKIPEKNLSVFKSLLAERHPGATVVALTSGVLRAYHHGRLVGEIGPNYIRVAGVMGALEAREPKEEFSDAALGELLLAVLGGLAASCGCPSCTAEREAAAKPAGAPKPRALSLGQMTAVLDIARTGYTVSDTASRQLFELGLLGRDRTLTQAGETYLAALQAVPVPEPGK